MRQISLVCALLLSGCAWFQPPPAPVIVVKPKRDYVTELRAESQKAGGALDIKLIQSPAIDALLRRVELLEQQKAYGQANELLRQAQEIEPNNPLVLQNRAEAQLRAESFSMAEILASQSFQNSAQLGPLCVRNWLTIAFSRELRNDLAGTAFARQRAGECDVPPVQRL